MEVQQMLDREAEKYREALTAYASRRARGDVCDLSRERETLVQLYTQAAHWFRNAASRYEVTDHTDRLFVERILLERSYRYFEIAGNIKGSKLDAVIGTIIKACNGGRYPDSLVAGWKRFSYR